MATDKKSWQPQTIRRIIRSLPTAAGTVLVDTDQGQGYLKAIGGDSNGPHTLACEWVGTRLAQWLGLKTLDFALIKVAKDDRIPFHDGRFAEPGYAFITRREHGHVWSGKISDLRKLTNPDDISRLVIFDTWTLNCDRHMPPRKPKRDNVFLSRENTPAGKFLL